MNNDTPKEKTAGIMVVMMFMMPQRQRFNQRVQTKPHHDSPRKTTRSMMIMMIVMGMSMTVAVLHTQTEYIKCHLNKESDQDKGSQIQMRRCPATMIVPVVMSMISAPGRV